MNLNKTDILLESKQNSRNSAVEWLKILGIVLIILSHVVQTLHDKNTYIGYKDYMLPLGNATSDPQELILNILRYSGCLGNTIFFVSSAWYLLDRKSASGKKILSMLVEIWIFSVLIMAIFSVAYPGTLDSKLVTKAFFPTTFSSNWYLTCYILFYAIYPFLNKIIYAMDQRTLLRCALTMSLLYIVLNYMHMLKWLGGTLFQKSELILWVTIYFCIAYMKLYLPELSKKKIFNWALILLGIGGNCIIVILANFRGLHTEFYSNKLLYWNTNCSPMLIMATIGMFNLARGFDFKNTVVNKISGLSLLIYIVHENTFVRIYLRPYIWQNIYKTFGYDHILMWTVIQVAVIFITTLLVCIIYKYTLQRLVNKLAELAYRVFCKIYKRLENALLKVK